MPRDHILRLDTGRQREEIPFEILPDAPARMALADELNLTALKKLRFAGRLIPEGGADWRLAASLGATMVQPCGITLAPVTTRVDEPVTRRYVRGMAVQDLPQEQEMPEDDTTEPLPAAVDVTSVMTEALSLAVPAFPRADGVELGEVRATAPGAAPIEDADMKPFAGLKDALDRGSH